ncbi:MAG: helix-turn-helix transcriptional regulator [Rubinisphaera brasiliensis]|uniref:Transcriptional regulator n=1 Tax=Rubinisphaera brasiliensis (strain ATCC 49424 / DSM 5305 / JCM 21570 / IAM 15109 / NBRC 103401 / IFAM 1448) TaxID=756272 RepID=F0SL59_RUBBR|nr:MarR family transcriptional regulator [Rubinisphaera brasiliensis]ADY60942.1 putative transcriptional regulator [Rubinisphaera brasiliensis DSM 5305]MBR9800738.1 MarR family transcriptional regulator [bacterium]
MSDQLTPADREFLEELQTAGASTISRLCELQGVTTTAVRQRLSRLQAAGFVTREAIPTERGRPRHEYRVTPRGQKQLGDNYGELATILWSQLNEIQDDVLKQRIVSQVESVLIERYGKSVDAVTARDRLNQLQQALNDHGFHTQVDRESDQLTLMERNCPYHDLAVKDRSICDLEQEVFSKIVGVPLQLSQRCVDGHTCCRFEEVSLDEASDEETHND